MSTISDFIIDNISNFSKELKNGQYDFYNFIFKHLKEENKIQFLVELENRLKEKFKQFDKDTFFEQFEELFQDQDMKLRKINHSKQIKKRRRRIKKQDQKQEPKQEKKKYKMRVQQSNMQKNNFEHFQKTVHSLVQDNFRLRIIKETEKSYTRIVAENLLNLIDELTIIQQKNNLPFKYHLLLFVDTSQMINGQKQYSSQYMQINVVFHNYQQIEGEQYLSIQYNCVDQAMINNLALISFYASKFFI